MTDKELREKIAETLIEPDVSGIDWINGSGIIANGEDGYVLPSKFGDFNTPKEADEFLDRWAKANGYISLADVQAFLAKHAYHYEDVRGKDRVRYSITDTQLEELMGKPQPITKTDTGGLSRQ